MKKIVCSVKNFKMYTFSIRKIVIYEFHKLINKKLNKNYEDFSISGAPNLNLQFFFLVKTARFVKNTK